MYLLIAEDDSSQLEIASLLFASSLADSRLTAIRCDLRALPSESFIELFRFPVDQCNLL
jgi:hypothetical protein